MFKVRSLTEIALCAAVIAVLSQLVLPLPAGVPMTLQTLGVAFCGFYLGKKRGTAAVLLYLLLGAVGLPVFSAFSGGVGKLIAPAGGFLWGFLLLCFLCGFRGGAVKRMGLGLCGLLLCHGLGAFWYALSCNVGVGAALLATTLPTLWKDALCIAAAFWVSNKLQKILKNK